ncbi:MAG: hypothetical protein R3E44_05690 [Paracoccaceae bacterium]
MSRLKSFPLPLFLVAVIAVLGGVTLAKGAFYLEKHEGDAMHLAELVLRMAEGQWPHLDFMTPIGVLAIAPIAAFVRAGAGLGHAILYSQILVAALLLLPVLRVAKSRLPAFWGYAYGAFVMVLCLALIHGESESSISISMHYNRWAWAVSYVVLPLALLTPLERPRPVLDGALIGLGLAVLALMKVTYFGAFLPAVVVALLVRRQGKAFVAMVLSGLAVAAVVTVMAGPFFWLAYLRDLAIVAGSEIRPQPGASFAGTVAQPLYIAGSLSLLAAVIFLRQAGRSVEGLALLLLVPGFFYVTYQNFGNDPQWLYLFAMLMFVLRPAPGTRNALGWDLRGGLTVLGILALAFGAPSAINLTFSPFRHLTASTEKTVPLLPRLAAHDDLLSFGPRLYTANLTEPYDGPGAPFAAYREKTERKDPATLNGETLRECTLDGGIAAWFEVVADDLEASGFAGAKLIGTDLFSAYWLYGPFGTVKGAAPWYYGGLPGVEHADYVVVPVCPMSPKLRAGMLKALDEKGWTLREVRRTELYILLQPSKAMSP